MHETREHFFLLDAMRGLAAIIVAVRHMPVFFGSWTVPESYLAVDLFFALSGVVVANAYESRLLRGLSIRQFVYLRLVRMYPLYILGSFLGLIPVVAAKFGFGLDSWEGNLVWTIALAILMLPQLSRDNLYPLNTPAWSLFFEMVANIAYAILLPFLSNRLLIVIMLSCGAAIGVLLSTHPAAGLHGGYSSNTLSVGAFRVSYSFCAGVLAYRIFQKKRLTICPELTHALILLAGVVALLLARPPETAHAIYDFIIVVLVFPIIVWTAMHCQVSARATRYFVWLGSISYVLYALHVPLTRIANGMLIKFAHLSAGDYAPYVGVAFLALLIPVCSLIDIYLDGPLRRAWILRFAAAIRITSPKKRLS